MSFLLYYVKHIPKKKRNFPTLVFFTKFLKNFIFFFWMRQEVRPGFVLRGNCNFLLPRLQK